MNDVAGENEFKSLTIPHLKTCLNVEYDAFKKAARQVVLDHYEEENENSFCQFTHDGAALRNKDKHQAFGIQFTDAKFRHNNLIELSFRRPLSHKAYKVAELVEEACNDDFDSYFTDAFSSPVQDLATCATSK